MATEAEKEKYLRSKSYALIYWHSSYQHPLKHLHDFLLNEQDESIIISARSEALIFNDLYYINSSVELENPVYGTAGALSGKCSRLDIYFWLCSSPIKDVKKLLRSNKSVRSIISEIFKCYNGSINDFSTALFLVDMKNKNAEDLNLIFKDFKILQCLKIVCGGVEVVYEYLLSNFIYENENQYDILRGSHLLHDEKGDAKIKIFPEYPSSTKSSEVYFSPIYQFSKNTDLFHLTPQKMEEYYDDYGFSYTKKGGSYPYYRLKLNYVEKINHEFIIPQRVYEILTQEQLEKLESSAADTLDRFLIFIFDNVFGYRYKDITSSNVETIVSNGKCWNNDMYEILGGDGSDSVYLGDGLSIDKNGNIVDD